MFSHQQIEGTKGSRIAPSRGYRFELPLPLCSYFNVQVVRDVSGVALGGALKNIVALAAGFVAGKDQKASPKGRNRHEDNFEVLDAAKVGWDLICSGAASSEVAAENLCETTIGYDGPPMDYKEPDGSSRDNLKYGRPKSFSKRAEST
jgi:hypothetical protein